MQRLYVHCGLPWLAHVDVDEFLLPDRPIAEVLDTVPLGQPLLAIAPWEALHDATLADDIFTARHFRTAFKPSWLEGLHELVFTPFHVMLPQGVLSHCNGKCFFRIGVPRLQPRIHGAFRDKVRMIPGPFCPDIALLHFHAQDAVRWRDNLQFRLTRGAYMFNPELQAFLTAATDAQIDDFYRKVQVSDPETIAGLEELGLVRTAELGLRARVERLLAERHAHLHSSVE
jgi:hypothetical protein